MKSYTPRRKCDDTGVYVASKHLGRHTHPQRRGRTRESRGNGDEGRVGDTTDRTSTSRIASQERREARQVQVKATTGSKDSCGVQVVKRRKHGKEIEKRRESVRGEEDQGAVGVILLDVADVDQHTTYLNMLSSSQVGRRSRLEGLDCSRHSRQQSLRLGSLGRHRTERHRRILLEYGVRPTSVRSLKH